MKGIHTNYKTTIYSISVADFSTLVWVAIEQRTGSTLGYNIAHYVRVDKNVKIDCKQTLDCVEEKLSTVVMPLLLLHAGCVNDKSQSSNDPLLRVEVIKLFYLFRHSVKSNITRATYCSNFVESTSSSLPFLLLLLLLLSSSSTSSSSFAFLRTHT